MTGHVKSNARATANAMFSISCSMGLTHGVMLTTIARYIHDQELEDSAPLLHCVIPERNLVSIE